VLTVRGYMDFARWPWLKPGIRFQYLEWLRKLPAKIYCKIVRDFSFSEHRSQRPRPFYGEIRFVEIWNRKCLPRLLHSNFCVIL